MENFNIKRFGQVFCRLLLVRKKTYFNLFLTAVLFFALAVIASFHPFHWDKLSVEEMTVSLIGSSSFCYGAIVIVAMLCGSAIISDLRNKQDKISELTLPASNLEKFVARCIGATFVVMLIVAAAFVVGDLLQQGVNMLIHKGSHASMLMLLFKNMDQAIQRFNEADNALPLQLLGFITANSIFVVGGMFFRKVAWLKTGLTFIAITFTLMGIFVGFCYLVYTYTDYVVVVPNEFPQWAQALFYVAITASCYYFAYRIYCRLQAINNKWINI